MLIFISISCAAPHSTAEDLNDRFVPSANRFIAEAHPFLLGVSLANSERLSFAFPFHPLVSSLLSCTAVFPAARSVSASLIY